MKENTEYRPAIGCMDVIDWTIHQYPTVTEFNRQLFAHEPATARHQLRVTVGITNAALLIGLPASFASLCGYTHDLGKRKIPADVLQLPKPDEETIAFIRNTHMRELRPILQAVPEAELPPAIKTLLIDVDMAHHEVLSNGNGSSPYPRTEKRSFPPVPEEIKTMQLLLALADRADRIAWGYTGMAPLPYAEVHRQLLGIASEHMLLGHIEKVAQSACGATPEAVENMLGMMNMRS